ncbi:MAG: hypothetical protein H0U73_04475 [Tatlockia sp.]|nr:hypothetical protein [Tatlockia sp.]
MSIINHVIEYGFKARAGRCRYCLLIERRVLHNYQLGRETENFCIERKLMIKIEKEPIGVSPIDPVDRHIASPTSQCV